MAQYSDQIFAEIRHAQKIEELVVKSIQTKKPVQLEEEQILQSEDSAESEIQLNESEIEDLINITSEEDNLNGLID